MAIDPNQSGTSPSAPKWSNWSGNIVHERLANGENYYCTPTNLVERKWVSLGGLPHNGQMFGFHDSAGDTLDSFTPPFNKNFFSFVTKQRIETRQAPIDAFKKYRETCDPGGLFYTQYLRDLLGV